MLEDKLEYESQIKLLKHENKTNLRKKNKEIDDLNN